ncbi:hypothetical protein [Sorangium sp. So ce385]|uniref:hypothetical protein n=1 Tax=Sorangium sp. So ce385 TaxID=3133308 RepID=UPI003F5B6678
MTTLLVSGCGALLGLDEFTDAPSGGTGGGDATPCERGDTRACYEGASETEGVGICAPGTQTCGADGSWGACEKQVLPGEEDCNERGDEDCDGVGCSDVLWARMLGAGPGYWVMSMAISPKGDRIALAGLYQGELNFGADTTTVLPEHSHGSAFLAMFDGEGNHVYSIGLPLPGDSAAAVALDADSNALFTTKYTGTVNVGGGDLSANGTSDMLVVKLDANGKHKWSKQFGGPEGQTIPIDIAVTPDGDAVITGALSRTVTFGGPTLETAEESDMDGFLVRLSGEDGSHVYSAQIGDHTGDIPGDQYCRGVGVDAMGRAVVVGTFTNSINFGSDRTHDDADNTGALSWVAQFDAKGMPLWSTTFVHGNDGSTVEISGVDVDPAGNVGIVGLFSGTVKFPSTNNLRVTRETKGADDVDLFVVRLSTTGTHSWSKQLGDKTDQSWSLPFQGVTLDSEGELVFAGGFRGKVDFGGGELTANDTDWFIAKFDASGTHRWSHRYGSGAAFQGATSAAVHSASREIVVAGLTDGAIDLLDPPLTTDNASLVLARLSP